MRRSDSLKTKTYIWTLCPIYRQPILKCTLKPYINTSLISALAAPYSSRALFKISTGSPSLSAIFIAFDRPKIKIN